MNIKNIYINMFSSLFANVFNKSIFTRIECHNNTVKSTKSKSEMSSN